VSLHEQTRQLVRELSASLSVPLLLDGDGITAACEDLDCIRSRSSPTVLTPHPGEMARLTGLSVAEVDSDRLNLLRRTAADLGATIVLKGARSLVGHADGRVFVNLTGNDGMATAGSGDVLCGAIAAMVGLGLPVEAAACKGVFLHGLAGDLAADAAGKDGMTAETILHYLPAALAMDRGGLSGPVRERYQGGVMI
jgi:NAD(P)H-hydrate epimerase